MIEEVKEPGQRLETPEQRLAWLQELVDGVLEARRVCDVEVPGFPEATVRAQNSAWNVFLIRHGSALGAITALAAVGLIDNQARSELSKTVIRTLIPSVVGRVGG